MTIRQRGLLTFLGLGILFALFVYWIANPAAYPFTYYPTGIGAALFIGAPGAGAIIGLIELTTGQPFNKIEESWAKMTTTKRTIASIFIILFGGTIMFTMIAIILL